MLTDAARYMKKAGKNLKTSYPNMIHLTCLAHGLHNLCETIREQFNDVDKLIAENKKIFLKAPKRIEKFRENAPGIPLPPKPVLTRWGTWLEACTYYADHFKAMKNIVDGLNGNEAQCIKKVQELFQVKIRFFFYESDLNSKNIMFMLL